VDINPPRHPRDRVIRQPRWEQFQPIVAEVPPVRRPHRIFTSPFILFFGFAILITIGGLLLALPISSTERVFTPLEIAFFTAVSAVTVTGHSVVNTSTYWSNFGLTVIFFLMLIGGLSFLAFAVFILALLGQRSTLSERLVLRETLGVDRMRGLRRIARNIILVAFLIYLIGAAAIFWRINGLGGLSFSESVWQSLFLSVSAFNGAGFFLLPDSLLGNGLSRVASDEALLMVLAALIILGGIGWITLVDLYRHRYFSRLALDTKLVITTSIFLWLSGAGILFLAEYSKPESPAELSLLDRFVNSIFHSVSARSAGLSTLNFAEAQDVTKLTYSGLMFIGGATGSVAGGIKVNAFAVLLAAVISSIKGRPQAEAFGREIAQTQLLRAITVAILGFLIICVAMTALSLAESDLDFLDLLFDTTSAFGTVGLSTGIVPEMSVAGKAILMVVMFIGRLGPLTLALALAPQEHVVYRFVQERVTIG
jgi:trk system potassium uptake protein TrkH